MPAPKKRKTEAEFSAVVRKALPGASVTPLESRATLGLPDLLVALPGRFAMVELKVSYAKMVYPRPHQVAFMVKHWELGCPVYLLARFREDDIWEKGDTRAVLFEGSKVPELLKKHVDRVPPLGQWPIDKIDWHEMANLMDRR